MWFFRNFLLLLTCDLCRGAPVQCPSVLFCKLLLAGWLRLLAGATSTSPEVLLCYLPRDVCALLCFLHCTFSALYMLADHAEDSALIARRTNRHGLIFAQWKELHFFLFLAANLAYLWKTLSLVERKGHGLQCWWFCSCCSYAFRWKHISILSYCGWTETCTMWWCKNFTMVFSVLEIIWCGKCSCLCDQVTPLEIDILFEFCDLNQQSG